MRIDRILRIGLYAELFVLAFIIGILFGLVLVSTNSGMIVISSIFLGMLSVVLVMMYHHTIDMINRQFGVK